MNKRYLLTLGAALAFFVLPYATTVQALAPPVPPSYDLQTSEISTFKSVKTVSVPNISVPTVVQVPFEASELSSKIFGVYNITDETFEPFYYYSKSTSAAADQSVRDDSRPLRSMHDGNFGTYVDFPASLEGTIVDTSFSIFTSKNGVDANIDASGISISFAAHVSFPLTVKVTAVPKGGSERAVVTQKAFPGQMIRFPVTNAQQWTVTLTHSQPLRISEVSLIESGVESNYERGVRFLAQPNESYSVYYNADRYVALKSGESPNLRDNEGVVILEYVGGSTNTAYQEADVDGDGIPDARDNCVRVANTDQADVDGNKRGDACDDFDRDGVMNSKDNCPNEPNRYQRDEDGDDIGDECDGEESRLTERHAWIPWAGMGLAALVLVALFGITVSSMKKQKEEEANELAHDLQVEGNEPSQADVNENEEDGNLNS